MLLTLKPHLGGLLLLAAFIHLWQRRDAFGRRAMLHILAAGIVLFGAGFLADPAWPVSYARSLMGFQQDAGVASCALCAGLPALMAGRISAQAGLRLALGIGALIFLALIIPWVLRRRGTARDPFRLLAVTSLIVLLASPYLLNYDFLLLLVPLALLAAQERTAIGWVLLGFTYLLPLVALGILGRQGNFVYPLCSIVAMAMLYWTPPPLDGSLPAA